MPEPPVTDVLSTRLLEVDDVLRDSGVGYSFGGAIALAYHVRRPRGTADLDVNLAVVAQDVRPLLRALPVVSWDEASVQHLEQQGWLRLPTPDGVPLDLFVAQHEFHDELQASAQAVPFAGRLIPVVSATHLTVLKAMFGRPKDWVDISSMLEAGSVDTDAALAWTVELLGDDGAGHLRLADLVTAAP